MPVGHPKMGGSWWTGLNRKWPTGEGKGKPLQYSCLENSMNSMKRQNNRILKEKLPRSVGAQYATGDQWRNKAKFSGSTSILAVTSSFIANIAKILWLVIYSVSTFSSPQSKANILPSCSIRMFFKGYPWCPCHKSSGKFSFFSFAWYPYSMRHHWPLLSTSVLFSFLLNAP